jgi:predicted TIM-barrel fold metal-dependent hydrolase
MAKAGFKVFDSDMHCVEPPDLWQRYLPSAFKERAPQVSEFAFRNAVVGVDIAGRMMPWFSPKGPDGKPLPDQIPDAAMRRMIRERIESHPTALGLQQFQQARFADMSKRGWTPETQLEAMDVEGVDITVVFPTSGLLVLGLNELEPEYAAAIAAAYNDWLHHYVATDPKRLFGAAMIAPHSVELAIKEAKRAVLELGFRAVFLRPNPVHGRQWYDPYYEPLWLALVELDIPLVFHEGVGVHLPQAGKRFGDNVFLRHIACHPIEMMYAAMAMCGTGVLERHPKLRVGFFEANCGWIPWLLDRMDDHYEIEFGVTKAALPQKPSTYFKRQCVASVETDESFSRYVIADIGDDNLVVSTDWPHPDSKYPKGVETFLGLPLSDESKKKILWDNCARFYGMDG